MRLLLVEDDNALSARLKQALSGEGFAVDTADNGVDAEFMGMEVPYDAVILDLGLPQRNGLEVLNHWREQHNHVPVIILTARDSWQDKVQGLQAGADDYLTKPFQNEELLARLHALIRRSVNQPGQQLQVAGWLLDESSQSVTRDEQTWQLTSTEFRLLRYFMLHPGKILSKTQLTEHVYEYNADKDSNVIEVYVKRLRKKLGDELITTKRGQGYVFGEPA